MAQVQKALKQQHNKAIERLKHTVLTKNLRQKIADAESSESTTPVARAVVEPRGTIMIPIYFVLSRLSSRPRLQRLGLQWTRSRKKQDLKIAKENPAKEKEQANLQRRLQAAHAVEREGACRDVRGQDRSLGGGSKRSETSLGRSFRVSLVLRY